ncbi:MAG: methyltransferase domain-containing protein, partial [Candidatus Hydrogenedentota bacterium]
ELRQRAGIEDTPIANAFFDVLVAFGIVNMRNGGLVLSDTSQSVLPVYDSVKSWNKEMRLFYDSLCDLTGMLKTGRYQDSALADYWAYTKVPERKSLDVSAVKDYSSVMDASQIQLSRAIADHYDFGSHEHVIDFGGGYGRLAVTLAERYSRLKVTIADLPAVCEGARAQIDEAGLGTRIHLLPVDFLCDALPKSAADAMLFVRVMHDWEDDKVEELMRRTRSCLRGSGTAVVVEPMNDDTVALTPSSVVTSLMLALFGGRRRSVQDYINLFRSAGYAEVSWRDCGLSLYKMVVARLPGDD